MNIKLLEEKMDKFFEETTPEQIAEWFEKNQGYKIDDTPKEYIICAAIWYKDQPTPKIQVANVNKGIVLCGHRHPHIIHQFVALTGKRSVTPECGEYTHRFVDRKEAMLIATLSNQIVTRTGGHPTDLYSEDLY
jgi:hypothetical protein